MSTAVADHERARGAGHAVGRGSNCDNSVPPEKFASPRADHVASRRKRWVTGSERSVLACARRGTIASHSSRTARTLTLNALPDRLLGGTFTNVSFADVRRLVWRSPVRGASRQGEPPRPQPDRCHRTARPARSQRPGPALPAASARGVRSTVRAANSARRSPSTPAVSCPSGARAGWTTGEPQRCRTSPPLHFPGRSARYHRDGQCGPTAYPPAERAGRPRRFPGHLGAEQHKGAHADDSRLGSQVRYS
jgi:hypothetical protein